MIEGLNLPLPQPECLFDMGYFNLDPGPFFAVARQLYPGGWATCQWPFRLGVRR